MKMASPKVQVCNSISQLMRMLGQPKPLHPLAVLLDYSVANPGLVEAGNKIALNFYKISFKRSFNGKVKYGQGYYDFEEGGLAFLGPNQVVTMPGAGNSYEGYSLYFHPDLIRNYPLGTAIHNYGFFSYSVSEALYLSEKEKKIISTLFNAIAEELDNNIDNFSQDVLVSQIELLLNYSNRFYNRQFITRKIIYNDTIAKMDAYLQRRITSETGLQQGLPTVQEIAEHLSVSPRYLSDMLKSLTGQTAQQYIHNSLIERAKDILSSSNQTIAEVAYTLGFEHPQSFNKLFKQKMEMSPSRFRQSFN